ncbi:MAG: Ig-like domain-containing protein [Chloroflexi bacterium]|nr:Ig-like domain-containing protein [Chloroflexota bacterium]
MPNYKSVLGADNLYYALVTQDDVSAYAAGTPAYLAPLANITIKSKTGMKTQYFDNVAMEVLTSEGESEAEIEIQGLPLATKAILLGKTFDSATGRMFDDGGGTPPYVALGYRALKSDGTYKHYWYLKCLFTPPDEEAASKADAPDPKNAKLKLTAIFTTYEWDVDGAGTMRGVKSVQGDTAVTEFDESTWFDAVQVPSAGAPAALTCTPSPVDGASSVAVSANITLTFSNALAANAEDGIILTTAAGVVKACARTINAARTLVTLDPTTNMAATTTYLVIVPGVTDVYGQTLADTVYDFATA